MNGQDWFEIKGQDYTMQTLIRVWPKMTNVAPRGGPVN